MPKHSVVQCLEKVGYENSELYKVVFILRHGFVAWQSPLLPLMILQRKVITCFYSKAVFLFNRESRTELTIVSLKDGRSMKSKTYVNKCMITKSKDTLSQKNTYPLRKLCKFAKTEVSLYIYYRKDCVERLAIQI